VADPGFGMEKFGSRIRDGGWEKVGSGINISVPQHWQQLKWFPQGGHALRRGSPEGRAGQRRADGRLQQVPHGQLRGEHGQEAWHFQVRGPEEN
jgi:hypothetical protein